MSSKPSSSYDVAALQSMDIAALQAAEVKKIYFWVPDWPKEEAHPKDDEYDIKIFAVTGNSLPCIPKPQNTKQAGSIVLVGCCKNTLSNMQQAVLNKIYKSPGFFKKFKFVHTNQNCAENKCRATANTERSSHVWMANDKDGTILEINEKTSKEVVVICIDAIKNDFDAFFTNHFAFPSEQNNEREVGEDRENAPEPEENVEIEEARLRLRSREGHVADEDDTNGSPPLKMSHNGVFNPPAIPLLNLTKAVRSPGSGVLSPIRTNSPVTLAANDLTSSPGCNPARSGVVGGDKEIVPERNGRPSDSNDEVVDKTEQENVFSFPEELNNEDENIASESNGGTAAL